MRAGGTDVASARTWQMPLFRLSCCALALAAMFLTKGRTELLAPIAVAVALLISAGMALLRNTRLLTLPFLLLCLALTQCYDSYAVFVRYLPLVPAVLALWAIRLIRLRPRFRIGPSFWPLVAVAVATLVGGLGAISAAEYFRPTSLFYVFSLGPGLVLVYLWMKNEFVGEGDEKSFLADLSALAITAAIWTYAAHFSHFSDYLAGHKWVPPQWGNNVATMLLFSAPALLMRARENAWYFVPGVLVGAAAVVTESNAGMVLGILQLLLCFFCLWRSRASRAVRVISAVAFFGGLAGGIALLAYFLFGPELPLGMKYSIAARVDLWQRGMADFCENPAFGVGFGYLGNRDIYNGKIGTMNWYHLFLAQVMGGLGIAGVLAWGWQLAVRARIALSQWGRDGFTPALCYAGLLMMTMINPGEFCPIPYAFVAVVLFVLMEDRGEHRSNALDIH